MESASSSSGAKPVIEFAEFRLDPQQRKLSTLDGTPLALNSRAFDTLLALVERRGEVLSKHQLMDIVWPKAVVEENNLSQAISALRKILGDSDTNRIILTVPGRGFCFVAKIRDVTDTGSNKGRDNLAPETINSPVIPVSAIGKSESASAVLLDNETPQKSQPIPDTANTLAERLQTGPIPVGEALDIAMQIIEALTAAHERGIVHGDLKPANIKLKPDGSVKVLDFGIAKALDNLVGHDGPRSPKSPTPATEVGVVLGTAAYMSPEQARGKQVDQRADIWAFGCVLYEMLTGQLAFGGEDLTITPARILERGADMSALPQSLAPAVTHTLKLCLEKDVRKRFADIRDVKLALTGTFTTLAPDYASSATSVRGRRGSLAFAVALLAAVALAIPALQHLRETPPLPPPEMRSDIVTPTTTNPDSFALSPDGRQIVFVAGADGASRLWLRSLATTTAQALPGTEGATFPFWSPDSKSIGFMTPSSLKRLDLGGGAPQTLAPVIGSTGGAWNADGVIVYSVSNNSALRKVSASGGETSAATALEPLHLAHDTPSFLPDGRFLFTAATGIYLSTLDGTAPVLLTATNSKADYLSPGWLVFIRDGRLVAQRLDLEQSTLTGEPVTLAENTGAFSMATTGLVAYRAAAKAQRQLQWVDRSGVVGGTAGEPGSNISSPRVAPDNRRVAVHRTVQGNQDIWLFDDTRSSRFTFDPSMDYFPVWSPDGTRIVFHTIRNGARNIQLKLASGAAQEEQILSSDQVPIPTSWSADGRFLLYLHIAPETAADLWVLPMTGEERTPWVFLQSPHRESYAVFSPDGQWVAYQSVESGQTEIYLRPFVQPGEKATVSSGGQWQVSTTGGASPTWSPDGKELYYLNPAAEMMAVSVSFTAGVPELGAPTLLFPTHIVFGGTDAQQGRQYDVAPDGRFLINTVLDSEAPPITLLMNWLPDRSHVRP